MSCFLLSSFYNEDAKKVDKNLKFPIFIEGDCFAVLKTFEDNSIDCVITSPPYFREREKNKHFNLNQSLDSYIENLLRFASEIKRVLKDDGSFWLNLGDRYAKCSLQMIPSQVAYRLVEEQGWILNNDVIWKKTSSTPTSYKKRLTNSHEHLFHFVKNKDFYYNLSALDAKKNAPRVVEGVLKTSSSVSGMNYRKIIESSPLLTEEEKKAAMVELRRCFDAVTDGSIKDFRILIRGHNKVFGSNRADEVEKNGFVVIKSRYNKPSDVWDIAPEKKSPHYAPFPEELIEFPIKVSCPPKGIVLDPFCGSGTTNYVAYKNGKASIGIDIHGDFLEYAKERCKQAD